MGKSSVSCFFWLTGLYHRRRHGFEVGGTNSGAKRRKFFLACPQICVVPPPNSGGTAGAYLSEKTDIVKITPIKKQGTVDLATSWYSRCFAEYTTRNLKQKVYILWRIKAHQNYFCNRAILYKTYSFVPKFGICCPE